MLAGIAADAEKEEENEEEEEKAEKTYDSHAAFYSGGWYTMEKDKKEGVEEKEENIYDGTLHFVTQGKSWSPLATLVLLGLLVWPTRGLQERRMTCQFSRGETYACCPCG